MDAAFERLDWWYLVLVMVAVVIPGGRHRRLAAAGLGLLLLATASNRTAGTAAGTTFATTNETLAVIGSLVVLAAAALAAWRARAAGETLPPPGPRSSGAFPDPVLLAGLALAAAAPNVLLFALGLLLIVVTLVRATVGAAFRSWLLLLVPAVLLLGGATTLIVTILGPDGQRLSRIGEGPFSPAAARLLVALLGASTLALAGLPPLHRAPWRLAAAPLAGIVVARIVLPALPDGLYVWQVPAMLVLLVSGILAAFLDRGPAVAVAAGLAALWSGVSSGVLAGLVLIHWGWLAALGSEGKLPLRDRRGGWSRLLVAIPALAALPALEAGLAAQVALSVGFVLGGILAALRAAWRGAPLSERPLY